MENYGFLKRIFLIVRAETFLIIVASLVFAFWLTALFLAVFKTGYSVKKRCAYFFVLIFACGALKTRAEIMSEADVSAFVFGVGALMFLPLFFIAVKEKSDIDKREFIRYIDKEIYKSGDKRDVESIGRRGEAETFLKPPNDLLEKTDTPDYFERLNGVSENENSSDEEKKNAVKVKSDLDFTHVKNVIKRLDAVGLSLADRRQVKQLEFYIAQAEDGYPIKDLKPKINESLGILLKIMARHGE